jgi:phosphoribosyl 1,2-cyclic phosphodiesterase
VRLRFASLGSGSRGNALLVEFGTTLLMVDCGLPLRDVEARLASLGLTGADVTALLVTHEHADHVRGVVPFSRRHGTPVWATHGTAAGVADGVEIGLLSCREPLRVGAVRVEPYPVPHDAREPCQFVFVAGGRRLGLLTDTGHVTPHIAERLDGCDALALECNHDLDALAAGPYPPAVKARVAADFGHLNNAQAAAFLARFRDGGLQWVTAMHVSERNNSVGRVREALAPILDVAGRLLHVARQDAPTAWLEVV